MKKGIKFELNGKEFLLRLNMNALITLEEITGKTLAELNPEKMGHLRALIYSAIKPKFTNIEDAGDFLDEVIESNKQEELIQSLSKAMENSMGK